MRRDLQINNNGFDIGVSLYAPQVSCNKAVIYIHGGGLLYGNRNDLPQKYIDLMTSAGFYFASIDYPKAPETSASDIIHCICNTIKNLSQKILLPLGVNSYYLLGRSSGAYLCFMASKNIIAIDTAPDIKLTGIISLYGYCSFDDTSFDVPSNHYLKLPRVPYEYVSKIVKPYPVIEAPKEDRYSLYVYARQNACWKKFLKIDDDSRSIFSLSAEEIQKLPPLFLAAGTMDLDVPYSNSKNIKNASTNATLKTMYGLGHDFDMDFNNSICIDLYSSIVDWMLSM